MFAEAPTSATSADELVETPSISKDSGLADSLQILRDSISAICPGDKGLMEKDATLVYKEEFKFQTGLKRGKMTRGQLHQAIRKSKFNHPIRITFATYFIVRNN